MALLKIVSGKNHGTLGHHLRTLKEFIEVEPSTEKYRLTERGRLLAACIQDLSYIISSYQKASGFVQDLKIKDHAVAFYETEDFKHQILSPFFRMGLQKGEAVIYLVPEARLTSETREVQRYGLDFSSMHKEAFTTISVDDWYLKKGKANSKIITNNWLDLVKKRKKAGFKGLRVAANIDPFFDSSKTEELLKYEESLGRRFTFDMCAICLYDWKRFDKKQFKRVYSCHSHMISKGVIGGMNGPTPDMTRLDL